jgi:hypothetical protein
MNHSFYVFQVYNPININNILYSLYVYGQIYKIMNERKKLKINNKILFISIKKYGF